MASDETNRLLNEIGRLLAKDTGHTLASILLYAKLATNMVTLAILIERGNHVQYWDYGDDFTYPLLDLWEEEEPAKRWAEMEYLFQNGKFTARFTYPEEIDSEEDPFKRRARIVKRYFGAKPIVYPPLDTGKTQQFRL